MRRIFKKLSRIFLLNAKEEFQNLKEQFFSDDTFIVSYPKSGNTWVRFILANLIADGEKITFHSTKKIIPDFEVHKEELLNLKRPRIIKSHSLYNKEFCNVIYIVRDVRDVYISYFYYLRKILPKGKTLSEFIKEIELKEGSWAFHYNSWVNNKTTNFLMIKYEDLLNDTFYEVKKIIEFLKLDIDDKKINSAIKNSSFENMKKIENKYGRPFLTEEAEKNSTPFVRKGKKEEWREVLSNDDLKFLIENNFEELKQLKYPLK